MKNMKQDIRYALSILNAYSEGKTIQRNMSTTKNQIWTDLNDFNPNNWFFSALNKPKDFRIKPAPGYIPLEAKDIPFPCRIRYKSTENGTYLVVTGVGVEAIGVIDRLGIHAALLYDWLFTDDDMEYSGLDGEWKPFKKK